MYPEIGYTGKDYTNLEFLLENYKIEDYEREYVFDTLLFLDSRAIEKAQKRLKAEYDKMKRKSG